MLMYICVGISLLSGYAISLDYILVLIFLLSSEIFQHNDTHHKESVTLKLFLPILPFLEL